MKARLFADADFIASRSFSTTTDGGRLLATLSRRIPMHDFQNFLIQASLSTSTDTPLALSST
jgi:hypothetical protein